jgi:hypothetical protein
VTVFLLSDSAHCNPSFFLLRAIRVLHVDSACPSIEALGNGALVGEPVRPDWGTLSKGRAGS